MQTRVQKWGNSLAVRIPKAFAIESRLDQDSVVDISVEDGVIKMAPVAPSKKSLEELLQGVTPDNLHGEVETGDAVGREVW